MLKSLRRIFKEVRVLGLKEEADKAVGKVLIREKKRIKLKLAKGSE